MHPISESEIQSSYPKNSFRRKVKKEKIPKIKNAINKFQYHNRFQRGQETDVAESTRQWTRPLPWRFREKAKVELQT